ncbi:hypothetical protein FB461_2339 [Rarobacter faecitabidus]|uniref:Uncharacterized protein n=1 Tax=Rarobacter faecitabidus TaxID=13243 RepID=A0A542ZA47_RARFA|nr:hypothetical protein FB461_2339 [Rarobacter faecitabidus]
MHATSPAPLRGSVTARFAELGAEDVNCDLAGHDGGVVTHSA